MILTNISLDGQKLTLLEAQLMEGEIQRPETLNSPVTETSASMEMIMSKSKPITPGAAIFYGGLIAGILDAADGVVAYYFAAGFNPIQVLPEPAAFMERPLFRREFPAPWLVSSPIFSSPSRSLPSAWEQPVFCPCHAGTRQCGA